jgi:bifunctional non-homologous end joining protein LigD
LLWEDCKSMASKTKKAVGPRAAKSSAGGHPSAPSSSSLVDGQLERYRAKRDFSKTAEPSGVPKTQSAQHAASAAAAGSLPFVIQKHAATRLHYDFRLGLHGVLKSWAVTKGPSFVPGDKRLAVEVEDHPMEYGGFEGTIPKGQYGGGTVMLWDEGTWEPLGDADASLAKGNLKFILHGTKLHGKWVLVRMGGKAAKEAKPNWLLIKEHDEYEQTAEDEPIVEKAPNSVLTQRDMDAIARDGDHVWQSNRPETSKPRTSIAAKPSSAQSVPFAPPGLPGKAEALPAFIAPQLASEAASPPVGEHWVHELKLDGYRMQAHIDTTGKVRLFTRSGLDWTHRMPAVARALGRFKVESAILDGEVVVLSPSGQSSFADLQAAFDEGASHPLTYFVFDLLHLNGKNLRPLPLTERKQILAQMLETMPEQETVRYGQHIATEGAPIFAEACRLGAEGIISKLSSSAYTSGRSKSWIKIKCVRRQELVIGGFTKPANGTEGIGALLLGYYEDKKLVYAGRAGTGFTQASSRKLRQQLEAMRQKGMPFAAVPPTAAKEALWVKPELVAEVQFSTWTADNLVRQASFKGLREDKKAVEVRREVADASLSAKAEAAEVKKGKATAKAAPPKPVGGSPAPLTAATPSKLGFRVTHPDKIIDPETALTKQALIDYYLAVAERMLPHVVGRPLSLVRCPNGTGKKCFYQKHLGPGMPPGIEGVEIPNQKDKGTETYVTVQGAEALAGLAQMNVLEIHPWGSTNADLEHPDRIIFDLDPDEAVSWPTLCASALEVKERLGKLGLESFVKTTGGKGLHVVAPIRPKYEWERIKAFTHAFTLQMEQDNSKLYISKMSKAARKNKIFVDYLRNERDATAVAPYSSRARLGMSAALPLEWGELKSSKAPRFLIADFDEWRERLRRDPWKAMLSSEQEIPAGLFAAG